MDQNVSWNQDVMESKTFCFSIIGPCSEELLRHKWCIEHAEFVDCADVCNQLDLNQKSNKHSPWRVYLEIGNDVGRSQTGQKFY